MFEKFIVKKNGFSIAEALIAMLIIALVAMLSAPIITKKKKVLESNAIHGKWVCYYDKNIGKYKYGTAADIDSDVKKWKNADECKFPVLSPNVKYLWVEVFGAGGGGSRGWAEPWIDEYRYYNWGDPVENAGLYEIEFKFTDYKMVRPEWDTSHPLFDDLYDVDKSKPLHYTYCIGDFPTGKHDKFYYGEADPHKHTYGSCNKYTYKDALPALGESTDGLTLEAKYNIATDNGRNSGFYKEGRREITQVVCTCGSGDTECKTDLPKIECIDGKEVVDGTTTETTCSCSGENVTTCVVQNEVCKKDKANDYWVYMTPSGTFEKLSEQDLTAEHQYCKANYSSNYGISSTKYPPYAFMTINELLNACNSHTTSSGKSLSDCAIDDDGVTHKTYSYFCEDYDYQSLGFAYFQGWENYGVKGTLELKPGETVYWKVISEGDFKTNSDLQDSGAYPLKKKTIRKGGVLHQNKLAKDGDTIGLYHKKNVELAADKFDQQDILIATLKGPTTGQLGKKEGDRCCTNCGNFSDYPNSASYNRSQCAVDGNNVEVKIEDAYKSRFSTISADGNHFRVKEQTFHYGTGCYGGNGRSFSSLVPASKGSLYKFHAGKGGAGAKGYPDKPDNRVKMSATEGEPSYFSWVSADGGAAASDSCNNRESAIPARPDSANIYNSSLGLGGDPGGVTRHQFPPKRDYSIPVSEDTHPHMPVKRWSVQNGRDGTGGMIVVSW